MSRITSRRKWLVTVTVVFLAVAPALGMIFNTDAMRDFIWLGLLIGALALALAWFMWSEDFRHHAQILSETTKRLAAGELAARTGIRNERGELANLAEAIDSMAESLEKQVTEREAAERTLLNRTHQQTVIAALGQFALATTQFDELLNQAVNFIAHTLGLEYCGVWEMQPGEQTLLLRAGSGWKSGAVGAASLPTDDGSLVSHLFAVGGALHIADLAAETRFRPPEAFTDHGIVSGVCVTISGGTWPFGALCVATTTPRKFSEDELHFLLAVATVIAMAINRQQTEGELHKLAGFAQLNPNPVLEISAAGALEYFNEAAMNMAHALGLAHPREFLPAELKTIVEHCLTTGQNVLRHETKHGQRTISCSFFPIKANRVVHCYAGDITDRLNLESALRQSQKMESVGQLAAGVAHDFNNMLTIIQGHSGVIMSRPNLPTELGDSAQAIYFASERAASLTRQLLMFSRKNIIQPKPLDLRETVGNMTKMLQRMIGEIIALKFNPPAELPAVRGDPGMIEQVIMNLGVNARDAMFRGGTLTLALKYLQIDADEVLNHPQARPGHFVCLEIADTGHGMTPDTQARIFEPFFTTKDVGKGTGLGLATVYGIVKQHDGWIEVQSEVNVGTTFSVYFPVADAEAKPEVKTDTAPTTKIRGGKETILIVEDEPVLRDLAQLILKDHGYRTLLAGSGVEALRVWERERANIDLLLTDMVMPEGMSGRELAERLRGSRPDLKVICVSGYSVEDLQHASDLVFLQKPYTRHSLAKTVRDCLDGKIAKPAA